MDEALCTNLVRKCERRILYMIWLVGALNETDSLSLLPIYMTEFDRFVFGFKLVKFKFY